MRYFFSVDGICRSASYIKDNDKRKFYCSNDLHIDPGKENERNDCLQVIVKNSENKDQLHESWMVMHGTPAEIVFHMDNEWPMSKLESDMIFDYLDTVEKDEVVVFTYLLTEPEDHIKKTSLYREARVSQQLIVAHIMGMTPDAVKVLMRTEA